MSERIVKANTRQSKIWAHVEHAFAAQKHRMVLVVRTIGIARATIKIGMANLVYNFQRLAWLESRIASVWHRSAPKGRPTTHKSPINPAERSMLRSRQPGLQPSLQNQTVLRTVQLTWSVGHLENRFHRVGTKIFADRVARQAGAPLDLTNGYALAEMPAADHTEYVHVDHSDASRLSTGS